MAVSKKEISPCPIDAMLSVIDGRWKGTILWKLVDGPLRTSELRRGIPQVTERMLIRQLQELVQAGVVDRLVEEATPHVVSYGISDYGQTMLPAMAAICEWGKKHIDRMRAEQASA